MSFFAKKYLISFKTRRILVFVVMKPPIYETEVRWMTMYRWQLILVDETNDEYEIEVVGKYHSREEAEACLLKAELGNKDTRCRYDIEEVGVLLA